MREGSLEAPARRPLAWRDAGFYDRVDLDRELRRVFEICHGCRRCFNLCDSFPRLFDLVDAAGDAELAGVPNQEFSQVVDACTLCDMCFMTKCPYVPPHSFNLDFPQLMLRSRAVAFRQGKVGWVERQLAETDRNGRLGGLAAPLANWAADNSNAVARASLETVAGVHRAAPLPRYHGKSLMARRPAPPVNRDAPAYGRRAVIFATCFGNYHQSQIGEATIEVLARNGVQTELVYPGCCGMPQLEHGDLARVAGKAARIAAALAPWIDQGYDVLTLVASCTLMMKSQWPLLLPDDAKVRRLSRAVWEVSEYIVDIAQSEGLADGLRPLDGGVAVHLAFHARAQKARPKAAELLRLIPDVEVAVIERCSGHGGTWGVKVDNYPIAHRVGTPAARQIAASGKRHLVSECPLAALHLGDVLRQLMPEAPPVVARHPIELLAEAYRLGEPS
jgi:glycerol-3-phosphate dehydrogenase subunit C